MNQPVEQVVVLSSPLFIPSIPWNDSPRSSISILGFPTWWMQGDICAFLVGIGLEKLNTLKLILGTDPRTRLFSGAILLVLSPRVHFPWLLAKLHATPPVSGLRLEASLPPRSAEGIWLPNDGEAAANTEIGKAIERSLIRESGCGWNIVLPSPTGIFHPEPIPPLPSHLLDASMETCRWYLNFPPSWSATITLDYINRIIQNNVRFIQLGTDKERKAFSGAVMIVFDDVCLLLIEFYS